MKTFREWLREGEEKSGQSEYQIFFNKKLEKYKIKSPSELSKEDKEKFFAEIEKEWTGDEKEVQKSKNECMNDKSDKVNEAMKLDYGTVIQFLVENLKDAKSPDSKEVLNYIGKNLK